MVIVGGPEARIANAGGVLERLVEHRRAHVQGGLNGGSVPAYLLHFVHALGHDLVDRAFHKRGQDQLIASTPGSVVGVTSRFAQNRTLTGFHVALAFQHGP